MREYVVKYKWYLLGYMLYAAVVLVCIDGLDGMDYADAFVGWMLALPVVVFTLVFSCVKVHATKDLQQKSTPMRQDKEGRRGSLYGSYAAHVMGRVEMLVSRFCVFILAFLIIYEILASLLYFEAALWIYVLGILDIIDVSSRWVDSQMSMALVFAILPLCLTLLMCVCYWSALQTGKGKTYKEEQKVKSEKCDSES